MSWTVLAQAAGEDAASWALRVFTALGGGTAVVLLLRLNSDRHKAIAETGKADADAVAILSGATVQLLEPLHAEIDGLRKQIRELTREVAELRNLLTEHGIAPPPPRSLGAS